MRRRACLNVWLTLEARNAVGARGLTDWIGAWGGAGVDAIGIGVVGDYRDDNETHRATGAAIQHAAESRGWATEVTWIATPDVEGAAVQTLAPFHALWIARSEERRVGKE